MNAKVAKDVKVAKARGDMSNGRGPNASQCSSPWPGWMAAIVRTGWPAWAAVGLAMGLYVWRPGLLIVAIILGGLPLGIALHLAVAVPWNWCRERCAAPGAPGRWRAAALLSLAHLLTALAALAVLGATLLLPLWRNLLHGAMPPASPANP